MVDGVTAGWLLGAPTRSGSQRRVVSSEWEGGGARNGSRRQLGYQRLPIWTFGDSLGRLSADIVIFLLN